MLPPVTFPTLGWQVIDWMEEYLCHGPGDVEGEPWEIDDEFALFLCWLYRVHPQDHPQAGRRLAQRGVLSMPKGRAKSEFAGGFVCAEALGPVRCDGFDADGDPVGVRVRYPFIRCLATEEDQSGNTYDNVHYMLSHGAAADEFEVDVGLTRTFIREPGGGEIVPSTSGDASKDGGKESAAVADETHLYVLPKLRQMYGTVARNTGKRKIAEPLMLDTTTAWLPGENSVAEQAAEKYSDMDIEEAMVKKGVLYDHHQGEVPKRFNDDRSLIKAMKPGYGPAAEWMDWQRIIRLIRDAEDPVNDAYRYWLNRARAAASHWLSPEEIKKALKPHTLKKGDPVCAGFDGSLDDDHTVLWICTKNSELIPVGIWARPEHLRNEDTWQVPRFEVDEAVEWMFEEFKVLRFYLDPPWWREEIGRWAAKFADPDRAGTLPIMEWWTNRDAPMAVATGALRTALRQSAKDADGNPVTAATIDLTPLKTDQELRQGKPIAQWHFENARTRKVRIKLDDKAEEAYIVRKERPGSQLKIDSVPGAVLARKARDDAMLEGEFEESGMPLMAVRGR